MNLLGIDFEEWFHPELIQKYIKKTDNELSVVNGIDKILELLRKNDTYSTFFMVGELLEKKPELMDKILDGGHEIGFHTMTHSRLDSPNYVEKFEYKLIFFYKPYSWYRIRFEINRGGTLAPVRAYIYLRLRGQLRKYQYLGFCKHYK